MCTLATAFFALATWSLRPSAIDTRVLQIVSTGSAPARLCAVGVCPARQIAVSPVALSIGFSQREKTYPNPLAGRFRTDFWPDSRRSIG